MTVVVVPCICTRTLYRGRKIRQKGEMVVGGGTQPSRGGVRAREGERERERSRCGRVGRRNETRGGEEKRREEERRGEEEG